jgi:Rieske Fe-S protein
VKDAPVGTVKPIGGVPVILGRDAGGLYAMTAICTHAGCDMTQDGSIGAIITCDCHGSRFDANGTVRTGPARTPLDHYRVDLATDGTITVQAGQIVAADVRVPVA